MNQTDRRLPFTLEREAPNSKARAGFFETRAGRVHTPIFMPVGTQGTVRAQTSASLLECGASVLLANTYHLLLRPGLEVLRSFGGLHRFMNWPKSILTDSGGYQVFSLERFRSVNEDGAIFQSYVDCKNICLTPELSIETQKAIGSDIMMVLDHVLASTSERKLAEEAVMRTTRWARRSLDARGDSRQALFAIVQGCLFSDLRKQSAESLIEMPFDGYAVGGLAVGESKSAREDTTEETVSFLPRAFPRYLMGVGTPIDLLEAVHRGIDMFDCILPTALAEQGTAFTALGKVDLRRGIYRLSDSPIEEECPCTTCRRYSRGYLHHLTKCKEVYGWHLIGAHNLVFYQRLMGEMRAAILEDRFVEYYRARREFLAASDALNPMRPPKIGRRTARKARQLGKYEIVERESGRATIKHLPSGETMHSVVDPSDEAQRLYIEQSDLFFELTQTQEKPLVIWDVGLGAGYNALSAIRCFESVATALGSRAPRALEIISFENDLDSLRLAVQHPILFPHVKHPSLGAILFHGKWCSKKLPITWRLLEGDFLSKLEEASAPDLIYFDPFSFKTDSPLWQTESFQKIRTYCGEKASALITYSASTAVRESLLVAGFFVGRGVGTGPKGETTIAFTHPSSEAHAKNLLGGEWLKRWERSHTRTQKWEPIIRSHPQFQSILNQPVN